jgi:hypothetical protein
VIISPTMPSGFVIFCDDIRREVNGKITLVGVYGGEMTIFGNAPASIPKLGIAIRFRVDPATLPVTAAIRVTRETASETEVLLETPVEAGPLPDEFEFPESVNSDGNKFLEIGINAECGQMTFTEKTTLRVKVLVGDDEYRIGALNVKLAPPETQSAD